MQNARPNQILNNMGPPNQPRKLTLEESLSTFIQFSKDNHERHNQKLDSLEASMKGVEVQVAQLTKHLQGHKKLPSQLEQAKAITVLRSDNGVEDIQNDSRPLQGKKKGVEEPKKKDDVAALVVPEKNKERDLMTSCSLHKVTEPYRPPISFLSCLIEFNKDNQFSEIFDMFSKININLPLIDMIRNILAYRKFFKKLSMKKMNYEKNEKVIVSNVASAMFQ